MLLISSFNRTSQAGRVSGSRSARCAEDQLLSRSILCYPNEQCLPGRFCTSRTATCDWNHSETCVSFGILKMNFIFIIMDTDANSMQPATSLLQYIHQPFRFNSVNTPAFLAQTAIILVALMFASSAAWANQPSFLSGTVVDSTGATIPGAKVVLQDLATGRHDTSVSDGSGSYSFPLAPGRYQIEVTSAGFKVFRQGPIEISEGADVKIAAALEVDSASTIVEVSADAPSIDLSNTQVGQSLSASKMSSVPLNGRSFTDLLATQPGVIPASSAQPNAVVMSGCTNTPPSGDLDAGSLSVSGQRETANGFSVNGSLVEEDFNNGTAVVPNLDSIDNLRVLTNNFDAEYGNFSGGQVQVTTKSGGNAIHGSAFEFLRNTGLDARNYFAAERAVYDRSQYGGSLGGASAKTRHFFSRLPGNPDDAGAGDREYLLPARGSNRQSTRPCE